jgi:hypothetical protein
MHPLKCSWDWSRYVDLPLFSPVFDSWNISDRVLGCDDKVKALEAVQASSSTGRAVVHDLAAAYDLFSRRIPFSFTIATAEVYNGILSTTSSCHTIPAQLKSAGCLAKLASPPFVLQAAADFTKDVEKFALLHIRRGDTIKGEDVCDNSAPKVRMFANCHLAEFPSIIFFTDEKDAGYIASVTSELAAVAPLIVDGEKELFSFLVEKKGVRDLDNYLLFITSKELKRFAVKVARFGGHGQHMHAHCDAQVHCARNNNTGPVKKPLLARPLPG